MTVDPVTDPVTLARGARTALACAAAVLQGAYEAFAKNPTALAHHTLSLAMTAYQAARDLDNREEPLTERAIVEVDHVTANAARQLHRLRESRAEVLNPRAQP